MLPPEDASGDAGRGASIPSGWSRTTCARPAQAAVVARRFAHPSSRTDVDRKVREIARWESRHLSEALPCPDTRPGYALLWAEEDLLVLHPGGRVHMGRGDMALVDRAVPVTLEREGQGSWTARLLEFGDGNDGLRSAARGLPVVAVLDGVESLVRAIKQLWLTGQDLSQFGVDDDLTAARLIDIIIGLCRKLVAARHDVQPQPHIDVTRERAETLIAIHFGDPSFSTAELAAKMRMSSRHLSSSFAVVGKTVTGSILTCRLTRAKAMLADARGANRQMADIAAASGFDDASYFARCFRRVYGLTPRDYRKLCRNQDHPVIPSARSGNAN